jgi:glycosyltransferase involved in cell wall biosynthesis
VRLDSVPADLRQEVRKKWGRNEQDFIITFAGNYFAHKGLGPLLRVLNRVDTPKNWYLHIFGKAQDEVRWQHLVRRQNLEHRVRFFGHVDRLSYHLVGCDVFCMPSKYESFGLVYIEAASIGLAIIATDVGVIRELISPEFSSFMLNHPPNEETMHERLLQLFRDRNLSQRFGADLCERAKAYRETDMVKATLEVYKKIIADSGRI